MNVYDDDDDSEKKNSKIYSTLHGHHRHRQQARIVWAQKGRAPQEAAEYKIERNEGEKVWKKKI